MSAVLTALPTIRPSCADDSEARTTLFRPTQKRPTWKDVERDRAARPVPSPAAPEVTRFFPKDGRTPPARLALVPQPSAPVATPSPRAKTRGHAAPWNRPGFKYPEPDDKAGKHARSVKSAREGLATIRPAPKALTDVLACPEWRGSSVTDPSAGELERLRALATRALQDAQALVHAAKGTEGKRKAHALVADRQARLDRISEARRIVHPSGATMLWFG